MDMKNKIVLFGYGFLGKCISLEFEKNGFSVAKTKLNEKSDIIQLDITDHKKLLNFISNEKPEIIINCVGRTDIDFLEKNPKHAIEINTIGPEVISKKCQENEVRLIHISTDSVFDGNKGMYSENDTPKPKNLYAKTKLDGEKKVLENCDNSVIIRTNFYGINDSQKYLFNSILEKFHQKQNIVGFNDVYFSPLSVENLSQQILDVTISDYNGIVHLGANKELSKYEFCKIMAEKLEFDENYLKSDTIDNYSFIAKRPKNTSLDNRLSKTIVKHKSISFKDWLESKKDEIMQLYNLKNV